MNWICPHEMSNPRYISFLLRERGWSQVRLAEATNRSQAAVSYAIQTGCPGEVTRMVVEILGVEGLWVLWPQRYKNPVVTQLSEQEVAPPSMSRRLKEAPVLPDSQ